MGVSVHFALLDAINAARKQNNAEEIILQPPMTVDKIRLACADPLIKMTMGGGDATVQKTRL
jgi:hypothetical protein